MEKIYSFFPNYFHLGGTRFLLIFIDFEILYLKGNGLKLDYRKESLGALCLILYYYILARQVKLAVPIGRQALQEIHSASSGPSPERQRMGRFGWWIRGLEIETKSAAFEVNTYSILLNDLSPPPSLPIEWRQLSPFHLGLVTLG